MSTAKTVALNESDLTPTTSYAAVVSGTIDASRRDGAGLGFLIDAPASCTGLMFKVQVQINSQWVDLYRNDSGTFVLEEYTIPLTADVTGQRRAIRLLLDGIRDLRLLFKGVGAGCTVKEIHLTAEQEYIKD